MNDFLGKYYPGIKQRLHQSRIERLEELLEQEKTEYKKRYAQEYDVLYCDACGDPKQENLDHCPCYSGNEWIKK